MNNQSATNTSTSGQCCTCPKTKEQQRIENEERQFQIEFENFLQDTVYKKKCGIFYFVLPCAYQIIMIIIAFMFVVWLLLISDCWSAVLYDSALATIILKAAWLDLTCKIWGAGTIHPLRNCTMYMYVCIFCMGPKQWAGALLSWALRCSNTEWTMDIPSIFEIRWRKFFPKCRGKLTALLLYWTVTASNDVACPRLLVYFSNIFFFLLGVLINLLSNLYDLNFLLFILQFLDTVSCMTGRTSSIKVLPQQFPKFGDCPNSRK